MVATENCEVNLTHQNAWAELAPKWEGPCALIAVGAQLA